VLVWLEFQDCAGNTESFLRASRPTAAEIVLDTLSVDYHETIMAAAGRQAEEALAKTVKEKAGAYIAVVEGSIPTGATGVLHDRGASALQIAREVCGGAAATIAMGTCATFGACPRRRRIHRRPRRGDAVPGVKNLINLSACPANVENLTALIVYFLTYKRWPELDAWHRLSSPTARRSTTTASGGPTSTRPVRGGVGRRGAPHGLLPLQDGCKGPVTFQNCPNVRWNEGTNWPIGCGHPCIGCASPTSGTR